MSTLQSQSHLIKRQTSKSFAAVCEAVEPVCSEHQFGVLGVIDLKQKINGKGLEFDPECKVFEVCNPQKAKNVLSENPDVSSALPCRLSVYTENGYTYISTLRPTQLLGLFQTPAAAIEAEEVEGTLLSIVAALAKE